MSNTFQEQHETIERVVANTKSRGEDYGDIPSGVLYALTKHVMFGRGSGSFIRAVLTNDFQRAMSHADAENRKHVHGIAMWLHNVCPSEAWGSKEAVDAWRAERVADPFEDWKG